MKDTKHVYVRSRQVSAEFATPYRKSLLPGNITEQLVSYGPSFVHTAALLVLGSKSQRNSSPTLLWASCY